MTRPTAPMFLIMLSLTAQLQAGDWPQFRYDAGRTAASPDELPDDLHLIWTRALEAPRPAFPHGVRLGYDASYEPVVLGDTIFVPSMVTDSVTAFDTRTGKERWRFFAEGPVRFAPVAWEDSVYFVSDDGHLYCVNARDGTLRWKFRGLPEGRPDRKVIGHGRLVSLWPARGGPVLKNGVVYFAAGIWPTEGVFVHAVDARIGQAVWSNLDGDHIPKSNWDHGVGQYAGLTPQGYLAIVDDRLVVPCGAQLPAFLDLHTGELQKYTMGWGGRNGLPKGSWFVAGIGKYLSHSGDLYDISRPSDERFAKTEPGARDYKPNLYPGGWTRLDVERANQRELDSFRQPVLTPEVLYESDGGIVARDLTDIQMRKISPDDLPPYRKDDPHPDSVGGVLRRLWKLSSKLNVQIKVGHTLYAGGPGVVQAIDIAGPEPEVVWQAKISGTPHRMIAADDKLFVVTVEGKILAFAGGPATEVVKHEISRTPPSPPDKWTAQAKTVLGATGVDAGYALVLGIDSGRLIEELARQSKLHVIAVDPDPLKVAAVRARMNDLGLYGAGVSAVVGDPVAHSFSPYLASLVVSETPNVLAETDARALVRAVYFTLRPYGGVACAWGALSDREQIDELVRGEAFPGAEVRQAGEFVLLRRSGSLPGAADWSHAEANAASTGASQDEFIRGPMAVLWFDAAQRWHKYPGQVQVRFAGGRQVLFEEGVLRASDVYTGRELWKIEVPLGIKPLTDPAARDAVRYARHRQWGPEASLPPSTQLVATEDAIYLSAGPSCMVFDPATGEAEGTIDVPHDLTAPWANLRVWQHYLVGSRGAHVVCVQRRTHQLLWQIEAARPALSLAVGRSKVFCSELVDPRRGENADRDGSIFAVDLATGKRIWQQPGGARFRYSPTLDVVVTPDHLYSGATGEPLRKQLSSTTKRLVVKGNGLPETGIPGFIAGGNLLTGNEDNLVMYDIASGNQIGEPLHWTRRGCTATRASVYLLTTRLRGNSAWIDLQSRQITPMLGVRPGCSVNNNLYPADGLLNMPNLTGGCTCNYSPASVACAPAAVIQSASGE